jgi:hypothetical protein
MVGGNKLYYREGSNPPTLHVLGIIYMYLYIYVLNIVMIIDTRHPPLPAPFPLAIPMMTAHSNHSSFPVFWYPLYKFPYVNCCLLSVDCCLCCLLLFCYMCV